MRFFAVVWNKHPLFADFFCDAFFRTFAGGYSHHKTRLGVRRRTEWIRRSLVCSQLHADVFQLCLTRQSILTLVLRDAVCYLAHTNQLMKVVFADHFDRAYFTLTNEAAHAVRQKVGLRGWGHLFSAEGGDEADALVLQVLDQGKSHYRHERPSPHVTVNNFHRRTGAYLLTPISPGRARTHTTLHPSDAPRRFDVGVVDVGMLRNRDQLFSAPSLLSKLPPLDMHFKSRNASNFADHGVRRSHAHLLHRLCVVMWLAAGGNLPDAQSCCAWLPACGGDTRALPLLADMWAAVSSTRLVRRSLLVLLTRFPYTYRLLIHVTTQLERLEGIRMANVHTPPRFVTCLLGVCPVCWHATPCSMAAYGKFAIPRHPQEALQIHCPRTRVIKHKNNKCVAMIMFNLAHTVVFVQRVMHFLCHVCGGCATWDSAPPVENAAVASTFHPFHDGGRCCQTCWQTRNPHLPPT